MIISDKYKFCFIHIPKCAGTSVRQALTKNVSLDIGTADHRRYHDLLGQLDYGHIPLFILHEYFPLEFESVKNYWSFAIVRDPFTRFASSVSQHLNMYSDKPVRSRSAHDIETITIEIIDYLKKNNSRNFLLPVQYIHFQKQVDYIYLDGVKIVDKVYTMGELDKISCDLKNVVGVDLTPVEKKSFSKKENNTLVFRNDIMRRCVEGLRPVSSQLGLIMSDSARNWLRDRIYVPRDQRLNGIFSSDDVKSFVKSYYNDDIRMFQSLVGLNETDTLSLGAGL